MSMYQLQLDIKCHIQVGLALQELHRFLESPKSKSE